LAIRVIPDHFGVPGARYHLIRFDKAGEERDELDGTKGSDLVKSELGQVPAVTDVFLISHGWHGDERAAVAQYDAWVSEMIRNRPQFSRRFCPLIIGVQWPRKPWGNDRIVPIEGEPGTIGVEQAVERYSAIISDDPEAREAMASIFTAVAETNDDSLNTTMAMPETLAKHYQVIVAKAGLSPDENGRTSADWSPTRVFNTAATDTDPDLKLDPIDNRSLIERVRDALLAPMRQLSFWTMKDRARLVGENGLHPLLTELQHIAEAFSPEQKVRFHLMGHSFGCIVTSAAIVGPADGPKPRKVHSLLLVQGALSIWAYAEDPPRTTEQGYFHRILTGRAVIGPIVTTRSKHDFAVGRFYPLGAGIARQIVLGEDDDPVYGGLGAFGIRGVEEAKQTKILPVGGDYGFARGVIYNVDASAIIAARKPVEGAHNDIVHPEVAAIAWQAVLATGA
jgi:hypothetical protein